MNDADIILGIKNFDEGAANMLYNRHKDYCLRFMNKKFFDKETCRDIYQDAVIVFVEKIRANKLILENTSIQTYLNSICRNQVLVRLNQKNKALLLGDDWENNYSDKYTDWFDDQQEMETYRMKIIREELDLMKVKGPVCYELLRQFYFEKKTMEAIAESMHYTNADNAKAQNYKCKERLKKQVFERLKDNEAK